MSTVLQGGLPPNLELGSGCTVEFQCADPNTGGSVAGVVLNLITIWVEGVPGDQAGAFSTPFTLVDPTMLHKA